MALASLESGQAAAGRLSRGFGFARSLAIYYGQPWRMLALRRHYRAFLGPGDLAFDVGAHAGNRTWCFAGLGAWVVAIEPQPEFAAWLRWLFEGELRVHVIEGALAAEPGVAQLHESARTPTVATLSREWIEQVGRARSFRGVRWEREVEVPVTCLDALIARYGVPRFCKIDVEGYEAEVLRGLSAPIPALSFEFVPAAVEVAGEAVDLLARLGAYRFNVTIGERRRFLWTEWQSIEQIEAWLAGRRIDDRTGDVYARLAR